MERLCLHYPGKPPSVEALETWKPTPIGSSCCYPRILVPVRLPLSDGRHWVIYLVDKTDQKIELFNPGQSRTQTLSARLEEIGQAMVANSADQFEFLAPQVPQQDRDSNSGVLCVLFGLHYGYSTEPMPSHPMVSNPGLW